MKKAPFPQANNIELIYDLFCKINDSGYSKFDVSERYGLSDRQGSYYLDALLFLGLVQKINTKYFISNDVFSLHNNGSLTKKDFCVLILRHPFLNNEYIEVSKFMETKDKLEYLAAKIKLEYKLNEATANRRASTILNWFEWINLCLGGAISE